MRTIERVLLVSGGDRGREQIAPLLRQAGLSLESVTSGGEARRFLLEREPELLLINAPLPDEQGRDLALWAADSTSSGVVLVVKSELCDELSAQVEEEGVLVLPKPLSRQLFHQTIRLALASRRRMLGLKKENIQLQNKIEEIRMVDRAKCALIQYLGLTEPQAHRYVEKQAMDRRVTRREIAESILRTYET